MAGAELTSVPASLPFIFLVGRIQLTISLTKGARRGEEEREVEATQELVEG
jgi:hypothetical protein